MKCDRSFDRSSINKLVALYIVALSGLALFFAAGTAAAQTPAPGNEDPNNWPQYHRTYNGWRYSPLDQINKGNVSKLKIAWIHQGGDITMGLQETPLVIDGVVYSITAGNRVAALDARTGIEIWRYQPKLDRSQKRCCSRPIAVVSPSAGAKSLSARLTGAALPSTRRLAKKSGKSN